MERIDELLESGCKILGMVIVAMLLLWLMLSFPIPSFDF